MTLACIVLAHRAPEQLGLLLSTLRHPRLRTYVHVDRRSAFEPFAEATAGIDGIVWLERRSTRWGGAQVVDATLDGLARAFSDGCGYFVLVSGQDLPLRPAEELVEFTEAARDRSYVEHFPLPAAHWRLGGRDRTDFYTYDVLGRRETCIPRGEDTSFMSWKGAMLNRALRARSA